jgi:hypothetical protein
MRSDGLVSTLADITFILDLSMTCNTFNSWPRMLFDS